MFFRAILSVLEERVASIEQLFLDRPNKSIKLAAWLPQSTVHTILWTKLSWKVYKIHMHQKLSRAYYHSRLTFCHQFNEKIVAAFALFLNYLMLSDETFHIIKSSSITVAFGPIKSHLEFEEHERDFAKITVCCVSWKARIRGVFFFEWL